MDNLLNPYPPRHSMVIESTDERGHGVSHRCRRVAQACVWRPKARNRESTFVALAVGLIGYAVGFAGIGVTGAIAGLIALLGPRSSWLSLEQVSH